MAPRHVGFKLGIVALGIAPALGGTARAQYAQPSAATAPQVPVIHSKSRSFRIPFKVDPADRTRRRELQLWVSQDSGATWAPYGATPIDRPSFVFKSTKDAEYWFAIRTLDFQGKLHPADGEVVEPSFKVMVDTTPPQVVVESDGRNGTSASIHWQIRDANPNPQSVNIEYQVAGSDTWQRLGVRSSSASGMELWDVGTTQPVKVRVTAADRAGNRMETVAELAAAPAATAAAPAPVAMNEPQRMAAPPGLAPVSNDVAPAGFNLPSGPGADPAGSTLPRADPGAGAPPALLGQTPQGAPDTSIGLPAPSEKPAVDLAMPKELAAPEGASAPLPLGGDPTAAAAPLDAVSPASAPIPPVDAASPAPPPLQDPAGALPAEVPGALPPGSAPLPPAVPGDGPPNPLAAMPDGPTPTSIANGGVPAGPTVATSAPDMAAIAAAIPRISVANHRFKLDYAVDNAGPNSPVVVELWVTRDGGRTWNRHAVDTDKASPFWIDLGAGTKDVCGLAIIARDPGGNGDLPPNPGDLPQVWVQVGSPNTPQAAQAPARPPSRGLQRIFRR